MATTLADLIAAAQAQLRAAIDTRRQAQDALMALREDPNLTEAAVTERAAARDAADAQVTARQAHLDGLVAEQTREDEIVALQARITPTGSRVPAHDRVARVGAEERTYRPDEDPRGMRFCRDVASAFLGDYLAQGRLARHMQEEMVERGSAVTAGEQRAEQIGEVTRAVGTGAFTGLVVPQYLTDMFAPMATAGRPFADACRPHLLPETGMVANIGRGTTGTSAGLQASEGAAVSETDYDDTLLQISIQTAAGQQTVSRQGVDRGVAVDDTLLEDLFRRYHATLDSTLINQAATGLSAVATITSYTDATPTGLELYPKIIEALSKVESSLLDVASGENLVVMHSRRWYWLQNILGATWPLITQPGIVPQTLGANFAERYGNGIRGVLPNGSPVIVDNNIAINLGAGTNEDEIYEVDKNECHLWEDPNAPMYIRADQTKAANLQILLVVYGYFAYTFSRYTQAQKNSGTGLITPTFTGA